MIRRVIRCDQLFTATRHCFHSCVSEQAMQPIDIRGTPFYGPIATTLHEAATAHRQQCQSLWKQSLSRMWIPVASLSALPLRTGATPCQITANCSEPLTFVNATDVETPHNVDVFSFVSKRCGTRPPFLRDILGKPFSKSFRLVLQEEAKICGFVSSCWVSETEAATLGWQVRDGAQGASLHYRDRDVRYFNSEDVITPIDFSQYFCVDRKLIDVTNVTLVKQEFAVKLQTHLELTQVEPFSPEVISIPTFEFRKPVQIAGTLEAFRRATGINEIAPLPGVVPFSSFGSDGFTQTFVGSQLSHQEAVVASVQRRRDEFVLKFRDGDSPKK